MFSFNGPHGACPACDGLGARDVVDPERVIGDPSRTLREGVVLAWGRRGSVALATELSRAVDALGVSPDVPWAKLPEDERRAILFGGRAARAGAAGPGEGSAPQAREREEGGLRGHRPAARERLARGPTCASRRPTRTIPTRTRAAIGDDELGRFLVTRTCDACKGRRLRPEALAVKLGGKDIAELGAMPLRDVREFVETLGASRRTAPQAAAGLRPARARDRRAAAQGRRRAPRLPHRRRARLPHARPQRADALVRRGAAHPPRDADRRGARRRPLRARRALRGPPRARQRAPHRGADAASAISATPSSSSSTTARPSSRPTTSSTWAPARACTAARSSRRARPPRSWPTRSRSPGRSSRASGSSPSRPSGAPRTKAQHPRRQRARAQPAKRDGRDPARPLHVRHRRLRQRQVEPHRRHAPARRARQALLRHRARRRVRRRRGPRAHRQGHLDRPSPHRPHAALEPRDVHRRLRAPARPLRRPPRRARARLQGRALLVQREGRPLRGVPGRRRPARRDALPARHLRHLRHVRRPPLQPRDARGDLPRPVDRRRARRHRRAGVDLFDAIPRIADRLDALRKSASATSRSASPRRRSPAARRSA